MQIQLCPSLCRLLCSRLPVIALVLALLAGLLAPMPAPAAGPAAPELAGPAWQAIDPLGTARSEYTLSLLPNGKLLAVGGLPNLDSAELYDPASGGWSATGRLTAGRYRHTATLLTTGKLLVAGGQRGTALLNSVELYDPTSGAWSAAGALHTSRRSHTATLLPNGFVLVVGGCDGPATGAGLGSVEWYIPETGTWEARASLNRGRCGHTATLLADGRVLVAGGVDNGAYLNTSEIYDPSANSWTSLADTLASPHAYHSATRLYNGKVLLAGGYSGSGYPTVTELFDPATNLWDGSGVLTTGRAYHGVTLLPNGYVLAAGGNNGVAVATAEMYVPDMGIWTTAGSLGLARYHLALAGLPNGKVLAVGGYAGSAQTAVEAYFDPALGAWAGVGGLSDQRYRPTTTLLQNGRVLAAGGYGGMNPLSSAELYNTSGAAWTAVASMHEARWRHTATLLPGPASSSPGNVLVVGGRGAASTSINSVELYDWDSNAWLVKAAMERARQWHSATLLPEGRVLVAGGLNSSGSPIQYVEVYDPSQDDWSYTSAMGTARYRHSATLLADGRVLVVGGFDALDAAIKSCEIYDPRANTWTATGALGTARGAHSATLLPDGRVLVAGGRLSDTVAHQSVEIYDPASGSWSYAQAMSYPRSDHSATLLRSGQVLVAGGFGHNAGVALSSAEVYDPAGYPQGDWSLVGGLTNARGGHTANLLFNGQVLLTGGISQQSAEVFNQADGAEPAWRPSAASEAPAVDLAHSFKLTGAGLRGYVGVEGSSGGTGSSPANYPLVQLRRIDNEQLLWLTPSAFTPVECLLQPLQNVLSGPAMLTTYVNGIPGLSTRVDVYQPVTLEASAAPIHYYQDAEVQVNLTTGHSLPLGRVEFKRGSGYASLFERVTPVYNSTPARSTATFSWTNLAPGTHTLEIVFNRQGYLSPASTSINVHVDKAPTQTTLTFPAGVKPGQPLTLSAGVVYAAPTRPAAPTGGGPTGRVVFQDGDQILGEGELSSGVASLTINLAAGAHSFAAVYQGDANHAISGSGRVALVSGSVVYLPVARR